jgi:fibronectin type 3 domain-containing protein
MIGKNKLMWLVLIALALFFTACDLESGNKGGGSQGGEANLPATPTNVRAVAVSSSSISVTWNTVSGATSYDVFYETGSMPITKLVTVTVTSYTHTGLQPNTTYHYYIAAKNDAGTSDYSSRTTAVTQSGSVSSLSF